MFSNMLVRSRLVSALSGIDWKTDVFDFVATWLAR